MKQLFTALTRCLDNAYRIKRRCERLLSDPVRILCATVLRVGGHWGGAVPVRLSRASFLKERERVCVGRSGDRIAVSVAFLRIYAGPTEPENSSVSENRHWRPLD